MRKPGKCIPLHLGRAFLPRSLSDLLDGLFGLLPQDLVLFLVAVSSRRRGPSPEKSTGSRSPFDHPGQRRVVHDDHAWGGFSSRRGAIGRYDPRRRPGCAPNRECRSQPSLTSRRLCRRADLVFLFDRIRVILLYDRDGSWALSIHDGPTANDSAGPDIGLESPRVFTFDVITPDRRLVVRV